MVQMMTVDYNLYLKALGHFTLTITTHFFCKIGAQSPLMVEYVFKVSVLS